MIFKVRSPWRGTWYAPRFPLPHEPVWLYTGVAPNQLFFLSMKDDVKWMNNNVKWRGGNWKVENVSGMKLKKRQNFYKNPKNRDIAHHNRPPGDTETLVEIELTTCTPESAPRRLYYRTKTSVRSARMRPSGTTHSTCHSHPSLFT